MTNDLPQESFSHYRLLSRIGVGGMGEVYLAEDTRLGRKVAVKVLPPQYTRDPERLRRFMLEARAASALNHPSIVTVFDIGDSDAGRFLVMEYIEGRTVRQIVAEGAALASFRDLGSQMARALATAHAAGIVHRDIKPDNIMVRGDGYVKVLDFGLARLVPRNDENATQAASDQTESGQLLGTLKYMSPEQAGGEPATPASDVYALGMVFFEMATGRYPHPVHSSAKILFAILLSSPGSPRAMNPEVPEELDRLICRMLHKDPAQRPTAAEVAAELAGLALAGVSAAGTATQQMAAAERPAAAARHTVGRSGPLKELRAALAGVSAGRGTVVCVTGEPGIGKSTVVDEFLAAMAEERRCTIARGRCSERLAGTEAYLPVLEALEGLAQNGADPALSRLMRQSAPTWHSQVAPLSAGDGDSARLVAAGKAASQDRMMRELGTFVEEASRVRPLLLFLDDLHWADVSTVDAITYLASQFDKSRVMILVTYRPSDMLLSRHPFLQIRPDLQARGALREIGLSFLSEAEIGEYLNLEFPGHRFPEGLPGLIHGKTEGSPLFMADLVRYLRDREAIGRGADGGPWELAQGLPAIERELPESVRGMIERKIGQLSDDDRKLLDVASVQGYEFDSAVVAAVLRLDPMEVEERLEKLERVYAFVRLMREAEFPNRELTLRYRFVHVLYQNALYTALRATRRATWSRVVAQVLERCHGNRRGAVANELAQLWEAAREFGMAASYFGVAARQASRVYADRESAALARRGLAALARDAEFAGRAEASAGAAGRGAGMEQAGALTRGAEWGGIGERGAGVPAGAAGRGAGTEQAGVLTRGAEWGGSGERDAGASAGAVGRGAGTGDAGALTREAGAPAGAAGRDAGTEQAVALTRGAEWGGSGERDAGASAGAVGRGAGTGEAGALTGEAGAPAGAAGRDAGTGEAGALTPKAGAPADASGRDAGTGDAGALSPGAEWGGSGQAGAAGNEAGTEPAGALTRGAEWGGSGEREAGAARRDVGTGEAPGTPQAARSGARTDQELMLLVILGVALRAVKGFSDPEVGEVFERARALFLHSPGHTPQMVPVLRGLWEFYEVQANYAQALPYAEQLLDLAAHLGDDGIMAVACDTMGDTSVWMGEFERAWVHLERGISLYDPEKHRGHLFLYGYDTGMACMTYGSIALWHLGRPAEARALMESARAIGERLRHPMTSAFVGIMGSWFYRLAGDLTQAEADGEMAVRVSQEHGLPFFLGWGMITRGWARVGIGWVDDGLRDIEEGMAIYKSTGSQLAVSLWQRVLAEAYLAAGRKAEAARVLDEALVFVERTGERVCERELREMRGRLV